MRARCGVSESTDSGSPPIRLPTRKFAAFVADTGYVIEAEHAPDPAQFPGAVPELLVPGALVFAMTSGPVHLGDFSQW